MTTRTEHLEWCKGRALAHVKQGELPQALASMVGDLGKHEETQAVLANPYLLAPAQAAVAAGDAEALERWIRGF